MIQWLARDGPLDSIKIEPLSIYDSFLEGKKVEKKNLVKRHRVKEVSKVVCSYECGPINTNAIRGYESFITITNDYFRFICFSWILKIIKFGDIWLVCWKGRWKMEPRVEIFMFIRYPKGNKGYYFSNPLYCN